jgi:hypothetical protein
MFPCGACVFSDTPPGSKPAGVCAKLAAWFCREGPSDFVPLPPGVWMVSVSWREMKTEKTRGSLPAFSVLDYGLPH